MIVMSPLAARTLVPALGLALLAVAGCGSGQTAGGAASGGDGDKATVVASFYPLEFLARQVGGEAVAVESLTKPGVEPHDLELDPRQAASLAKADLVLYLEGFQPAVDKAVEQNKPKAALEVSSVVPLTKRTGQVGEHAEEKAPGTGSPGADEHAKEGDHDEPGGDPHLWLDPTKYAKLVPAVADHLAKVDPDQAEKHRSRAADLTKRLEALDAEYSKGLATCARRDLVTAHTAFGYLADRYRLTQVGISGLDPEAEPDPGRLAEVEKVVRDRKVTTIFFETLVSPKTAETLARDTSVKTAALDPLEGLAEPGKQDYFSVMRANLTELRKGLSCQ
jgi:zinc transport system substrate-binding protein